MKLLLTFTFCWVIILASGADQPIDVPAEKNTTKSKPDSMIEPTPKPNPSPSPSTSLSPPNTTTSTPTPPPSNTTTPVPPTPPAPPKTTTSTTSPPKTTTSTPSPPNTTTSTPSPPNTTTHAPSPDPTPGPAPAPTTGQWMVNGTNYTCIVLRMAAQFDVSYVTKENKTLSKKITLPSSNVTMVNGTCGEKEQIITISWNSSVVSMMNDSITLHFMKNVTSSSYSLHHLEVLFAAEEFPQRNSSALMLMHNASVYQIPLINSYRCLKLQKISLINNVTNTTTTGILEVSDLQFQAFKNEKSSAFSTAQDCPFDSPDYVPIAVGCGLIILVIVVLVAYLVGRRRQSRGYVSM